MFRHKLLVTGLALLAAIASPVAPAVAQTPNPPSGDWPERNRTLGDDGYSPLAQIPPANVRRLRPVPTFETGVKCSFQTVPAAVDGTMYRTTYNHTYAIDAATGKQVWKFNTLPKSGPAVATWLKKGPHNPPTGGATWTTYSLDSASGVVYVGTGNVAPDFAEELHPGDNLYTSCLVALDAKTGQLLAFIQPLKHDYHDWDMAAAPALITTRAGRHLAAAGSKDGFLYGIDLSGVRRTAGALPASGAGTVRPVAERSAPAARRGDYLTAAIWPTKPTTARIVVYRVR